MTTSVACPARGSLCMDADETRNVSIDFRGKVDAGELLTGTPTVVQDDGGSELTLSNKQVNTVALTFDDKTVPIGAAVQFTIAASAAGTYSIKVTVATDGSQTVTWGIDVTVE